MDFWKPYIWRIIFTLAGIAAGISFLTLGVTKTLLILLCCIVGYLIGMKQDKGLSISEKIRTLLNRMM